MNLLCYLVLEVFEKHITTVEGVERIDWSAAVSKEKIVEIRRRSKFIEENILMPADDPMELNEAELNYRNRQIRCVEAREVKAGEILQKEDIALKIVENQEDTFTEFKEVIGKTLSRTIQFDEPIFVKDIKKYFLNVESY